MPEADDLHAVLTELEEVIREKHPDLLSRLAPGLSERELGLLAETILPCHLPVELEILYRWHNGWDHAAGSTYRYLLPECSFASLGSAINHYWTLREIFGNDGWHPLWFPAFVLEGGEMVALQLEPGRPAGQVFAYHAEMELMTSYDSVTALFSTALDLWRVGLLPEDVAYPEIRRAAAERSPRSRTPDGEYRREISRRATRDWPAEWREVLRIAPMTPATDDELVTIAELAVDPDSRGPVRADLQGVGGSIDQFFAKAIDASGSVTVFLMQDRTENFREGAGGGPYHLWLSPILDGSPFGPIAAQMRSAGAGDMIYLVTKIVPV